MMRILKNKGFSLLEILVALAIFGILISGLLAIMEREKLLIRSSTEVLEARLIADKTMETLKTRPFEKLQSYSLVCSSELKDMTGNVLVSDFGSSALKKIVVTIQWVNPQGLEKKLILSTLRSKYPLIKAEG
jgi:prepilin-type N-terminal cleavage/methylation domain-containing protein